jgi:hypothetical protein
MATEPERDITEILKRAGFTTETNFSDPEVLQRALRALSTAVEGCDELQREIVRGEAVTLVTEAGVKNAKSLVAAAIRLAPALSSQSLQGGTINLTDPEPWPDPVDGDALLDDLKERLDRYIHLPSGASTAIALWIIHTYIIDTLFISPILGITSPVKRCGKTNLLILLGALCRRPMLASNISPAALYRTIESNEPTLLIDEGETFLIYNQTLRGILNAGHSRTTAKVHRTVGDDHQPVTFSTFCPKAIALIGRLPATLEDRAILIRMQRRAPGETLDEFRQEQIHKEGESLRRRATRWSMDHKNEIPDVAVPTGLNDRARDNWRPLIQIATCAGGEWPEMTREVAPIFTANDEIDTADGVALLADIREILSSYTDEKIPSAMLVTRLAQRSDRPWASYRGGKPMNELQMAQVLRPFDISPKKIRIGNRSLQGYEVHEFDEAVRRYVLGNLIRSRK